MAKLLWWKVIQKAGSSGGMYQGPGELWQQPMPAVAHCQPGKESLVCSLFLTKLLVPHGVMPMLYECRKVLKVFLACERTGIMSCLVWFALKPSCFQVMEQMAWSSKDRGTILCCVWRWQLNLALLSSDGYSGAHFIFLWVMRMQTNIVHFVLFPLYLLLKSTNATM